MESISSRSITDDNSQIYIDMLLKDTRKWNYFIALVESYVPAEEALMMTREKFDTTIIDVMHRDLTQYGHEQD